MKQQKRQLRNTTLSGDAFFKQLSEESWAYSKTIFDMAQEPIVLLDKDLRVIVANTPFYTTFQVDPKDTEGVFIYELGGGRWSPPVLRDHLEEILPQKTFFKGMEITHKFPLIGRKVMILNARQIQCDTDVAKKMSLPTDGFILLAMEDVTEMMLVAEVLASRNNTFEEKSAEWTRKMQAYIFALESENNELKKKIKNT